MADRLKSLIRIEAVQKQMVRLTEMRLAAAERICRELAEDRARLETYVTHEGSLGAPLAKAALASLHGLDRRGVAAAKATDMQRAALSAAKRRERVAGDLREREARAAGRAAEDRALAETMEGWFAARRTSLP